MSIPSRRKFWGGPGNSPSPGPRRLPPLRSLRAGWGRRGGTLLPFPLPLPPAPRPLPPAPAEPRAEGTRPAGRAEPGPRDPSLTAAPRSLRSRRGSSGDTDTGARIPRRAIFGKQGPTAAGTTARHPLLRCPSARFSAQLRQSQGRSTAPGRSGTDREWRGGARCCRGGRWDGHRRARHSRHHRITLLGQGAAGPTFLLADPPRSDGVHSQSHRPRWTARQSTRSWWAGRSETWTP